MMQIVELANPALRDVLEVKVRLADQRAGGIEGVDGEGVLVQIGIVGMKRRLGLHGNVMARPAPPLFYALPVSRRGAYREANGHGDYRTGSA